MTCTYAEEKENEIASNKGSKDAQIPPPVAEIEAQGAVELVADRVSAVRAIAGGVVDKVSGSHVLEKGLHVVSASLSCWRSEGVQFARSATDRAVVQLGDDHAANQACEGIELVQPGAPETRNLRFGNGDTAEKGKDNDHKWIHCSESASLSY